MEMASPPAQAPGLQDVVSRFDAAEGTWRSTVGHLEDQLLHLQRQLGQQQETLARLQQQQQQQQGTSPTLASVAVPPPYPPPPGISGTPAAGEWSGVASSMASTALPLASSSSADGVGNGSTASARPSVASSAGGDDALSRSARPIRGMDPEWRPFGSTTSLAASLLHERDDGSGLDASGASTSTAQLTPGPRRADCIVEVVEPPLPSAHKDIRSEFVDAFVLDGTHPPSSSRRRSSLPTSPALGPADSPADGFGSMSPQRRADFEAFHQQLQAAVSHLIQTSLEAKASLCGRIEALEGRLTAQAQATQAADTSAAVARAELEQQNAATNELVALLNSQITAQREALEDAEAEAAMLRDEAVERDAREEESIALVNEWYSQVSSYLEQIAALQDAMGVLERENELLRDADSRASQELSGIQQMHDELEALKERLASVEDRESAAMSGLVERSTLAGVSQAQQHEIQVLRKKLSLAVLRAQEAEEKCESIAEENVVLQATAAAALVRLHHHAADGLRGSATAERGLRSTYVASSMEHTLYEANKEIASAANVLRAALRQLQTSTPTPTPAAAQKPQPLAGGLPVASAELELRANVKALRQLAALASDELHTAAAMGLAQQQNTSSTNTTGSASGTKGHISGMVQSALRKPLVYQDATA